MIKFIDLFCGIGGFRVAMAEASKELNIQHQCVFSSDIDQYSQKAYYENFGDFPHGDITQINEEDIPDHDVLFAGFPCQPFSIIGQGRGFDDTRGTLFFDIARILNKKRPKAFVLENVKRLVGHQNGETFKKILETLREIGYQVDYKVLNALDYGLPHKRERVFIVGFHQSTAFEFPEKHNKCLSLSDILEKQIDQKYYASEHIRTKRQEAHQSKYDVSIWHENKSGNISSHPFSCALRANASYNYLLVNGERRLTAREMLRLQGFPDYFKIAVPEAQVRKQAGNSLPVNVAKSILLKLLPHLDQSTEKVNNFEFKGEIYERKNYAKTSYSRES